MERLLEAAFNRLIRSGTLDLTTASGRHLHFGDGLAPHVAVRFTDRAAQRACLLNPALRLGEMFMDGRFVVERGTIYDFLTLVMSNTPGTRAVLPLSRLQAVRARLKRDLTRNSIRRAAHNVAHHYDLHGSLYDLFLDRDRQYSCAYFEHPDQSLDDAQLAKKRHTAAKLLVEPGSRVLDIGCGWGGLDLYLAEVTEAAQITGVTLSREQHAAALRRAADRGLLGRVRFDLKDYRQIDGRFDRIVSVGMFEHVGLAHYDAFFGTAARLLTDDGVMLLHTIGATGEPGPINPWIERYIFPGGHLPTLSEIMPAVERSGLRLADIEVLRLHYAETLRAWRERFLARRAEAARLYDERFCRMWEFYLAASEMTFREEGLVVFQIQLAKRNDTVPLTRAYIAEREEALRRHEALLAAAPPRAEAV